MRRDKEEHFYGIESVEQFKEFDRLKKESIERHPERTEQILVDFCNMCYRDYIFNFCDVILEFNDYGIDEREFYKKYHMNEKGIYPREQQKDLDF